MLSRLDCRPVVLGTVFCSYFALVKEAYSPFSAGCVSVCVLNWSAITQTLVCGKPVKFVFMTM